MWQQFGGRTGSLWRFRRPPQLNLYFIRVGGIYKRKGSGGVLVDGVTKDQCPSLALIPIATLVMSYGVNV